MTDDAPKAIAHDHPTAVFVPNWRTGNPYLELLSNSVQSAGYNVVFANFPHGSFKLLNLTRQHPDATVLHLHWLPRLLDPILWCSNGLKLRIKLLLLAAEMIWIKKRGVRIIWTIHNLYEHETPNRDVERRARRVLALHASHVIIHSKEALAEVKREYGISLEKRAAVIPHGNYDGCYVEDRDLTMRFKSSWQLKPEHTVLLFFGAVRPYKGIDQLLAALSFVNRPDLRIIVAGQAWTPDIERQLQNASEKDPRLLLALGFIPEEQVASFFSLAHAVALPFERTLTSGSALLAMTFGKALVLPTSAKVLGIANVHGALFFDDANELARHIEVMTKDQLLLMGSYNRKASANLSWGNIGRSTVDVYNGATDTANTA